MRWASRLKTNSRIRSSRRMSGPPAIGAGKRAHLGIAEEKSDFTLAEIAARQQILRRLLQDLPQQALKAGVRFAQAPLQRALRHPGTRTQGGEGWYCPIHHLAQNGCDPALETIAPTRRKRAVFHKTRGVAAKSRATTPASRKSKFPVRCSKAARTFARLTTAAATARLRVMRSRLIRLPATSDSDVSLEKGAHNDQHPRSRRAEIDKRRKHWRAMPNVVVRCINRQAPKTPACDAQRCSPLHCQEQEHRTSANLVRCASGRNSIGAGRATT